MEVVNLTHHVFADTYLDQFYRKDKGSDQEQWKDPSKNDFLLNTLARYVGRCVFVCVCGRPSGLAFFADTCQNAGDIPPGPWWGVAATALAHLSFHCPSKHTSCLSDIHSWERQEEHTPLLQ